MWNILIGFSYPLTGGDVFHISEFRYKSIPFFLFGVGGDKSLNPCGSKTDAPSNVQIRKIRKRVH